MLARLSPTATATFVALADLSHPAPALKWQTDETVGPGH
jgi:hypothetical protein